MNFKDEYNSNSFVGFLQHKFLPDDFIPIDEALEIDFSPEFIHKIKLIGKIESLDLKVLEIVHNSENDPRVSLTDESSKIMKNYNTKRALAVFISNKSKNYRLSLITIDISLDGSKVTRKLSNPKRYSYYLGPDAKVKTPTQYLQDKGPVKSFEDLLSRFSVEVVTQKFFDEFRLRFQSVKENFEKFNKAVCLGLKDKYIDDEYDEILNKFCFTFLGRLIFIYFLQRKRWIENDSDFIRKFINNPENINLYQDFFSPLFFEVFAKKPFDRSQEIKNTFKNTPYLNGGLFEKSKLEEENPLIYLDGNFLRDLINNFFEIYNFTVDENTLYDQEVSIDPEMLGKVFENTLAENERGKKGTFYTPREIVNFMVRDSLQQFLINETDINSETLKDFIFNENINSFSLSEIRIIDNKLEDIKVLDPAVGSGAFPVEMLNVLVSLRKKLDVKVGTNVNEIDLKKKFIRKNLYGVDIDSGAIEIAKLRLWLSLIVDYERIDIEPEPLPNLDFQFRLGNSLQERIAGFEIIPEKYLRKKTSMYSETEQLEMVAEKKEKFTAMQLQIDTASEYVEEMEKIIDKYFNEENVEIKKKYKEKFDELENKIFEARIEDLKIEAKNILGNVRDESKKIKLIKQKMEEIGKLEKLSKEGIHKLFIPRLHFAEVYDEKDGFDIVIGNPPYGIPVDDKDVIDFHELGSKDSYGFFIATSIKRFLKKSGILSIIVSDTWLTIKEHKKLREIVLEKNILKIIRLHQDCFDATVNACIVLLVNKNITNNNEIIAADYTNISTRKEVTDLREKFYSIEKYIGLSNAKYGVYKYNQIFIKNNTNLPIFVGSPKLFQLLNDVNCDRTVKEIDLGKEITKIIFRSIIFNEKKLELVKLNDIVNIPQGLKTGDNPSYIYKEASARGKYKCIDSMRKLILKKEDLHKIYNNEKLRIEIINKGINKDDKKSDKYFGGRYIIQYDKGGKSSIKEKWLPNYNVSTQYFIDWSEQAVNRMKTLTIKERNKEMNKKGNDNKVCSRFQNIDYYFKNGITFSPTGIYSPTFRFNSKTIFDGKGSTIFLKYKIISENFLVALLSSKLFKYLYRNYINHTVEIGEKAIGEIVINMNEDKQIINLVNKIIEKQEKESFYDYSNNEQKEIDKIIYNLYCIDNDDIHEIEIWYNRRYPKLSAS